MIQTPCGQVNESNNNNDNKDNVQNEKESNTNISQQANKNRLHHSSNDEESSNNTTTQNNKIESKSIKQKSFNNNDNQNCSNTDGDLNNDTNKNNSCNDKNNNHSDDSNSIATNNNNNNNNNNDNNNNYKLTIPWMLIILLILTNIITLLYVRYQSSSIRKCELNLNSTIDFNIKNNICNDTENNNSKKIDFNDKFKEYWNNEINLLSLFLEKYVNDLDKYNQNLLKSNSEHCQSDYNKCLHLFGECKVELNSCTHLSQQKDAMIKTVDNSNEKFRKLFNECNKRKNDLEELLSGSDDNHEYYLSKKMIELETNLIDINSKMIHTVSLLQDNNIHKNNDDNHCNEISNLFLDFEFKTIKQDYEEKSLQLKECRRNYKKINDELTVKIETIERYENTYFKTK